MPGPRGGRPRVGETAHWLVFLFSSRDSNRWRRFSCEEEKPEREDVQAAREGGREGRLVSPQEEIFSSRQGVVSSSPFRRTYSIPMTGFRHRNSKGFCK